jgi:hypothetical protein
LTHRLHVKVITSCTGQKVALAPSQSVAAERLYRGQQHLRLMSGADILRDTGATVDVWIVSAGHGLVHGRQMLSAYEQTFQGRGAGERRRMADELDIPSQIRTVLSQQADLTIVLLGEAYLDACGLDDDLALGSPTLVFASASASLAVRAAPGMRVVGLRVEDTRRFGAGFVALKGEIGGRLLAHIATGGSIGQLLRRDPLSQLASFRWAAPSHLATAALF